MNAEPVALAKEHGPHVRRPRRRGRRVALGASLVVLLAAGGYVGACAIAPLPELSPALLVPAQAEIVPDPAPAQSVLTTQARPTAFGWAQGDEVWSNDDSPRPLASVTKLVSALVAQEASVLAPGENGADYVWTEADVARQAQLIADNGVAFPIPAGTVVSARDMLTLMLLPSANDFAAAYVYSIFGSNEAFVAAAKDWATRHELDSLTIVEPSGMEEGNQANAADVVRIARLVLEDPTLAGLTQTKSADIPAVGVVTNTNPLLGDPGVIGLKTGRSSDAGYNLVAAQSIDVDGRSAVSISVVLNRATAEGRADASRALLASMSALPQRLKFAAEGEKLGSVVTWAGEVVPLHATANSAGTLLPGESATREISLGSIEAGPAQHTVGSIMIDSPAGADQVSVVTDEAIAEPDLWWRITHPKSLFGWG